MSEHGTESLRSSRESGRSPSSPTSGSFFGRFKNKAVEQVRIITRTDSQESTQGEKNGATRPWIETFIRFGPLSGVFCILLAIASLIASLGILAGSNGQDVTTWSAPPSTYIAIFTAIGNLSVRYAAAQGVVVTWWQRALKGTTLRDLDRSWRTGTSFRGAITSIPRGVTLLALACILSTLVVVDGPLLQRSSTVVPNAIGDKPTPLTVFMSPEVPRFFTGAWIPGLDVTLKGEALDTIFNATYPTFDGQASNTIETVNHPPWEIYAVEEWYRDRPLPKGTIKGCPGQCKAKVRAPALAEIGCSSESIEVDYLKNVPWNNSAAAPPLYYEMFYILPALQVDKTREIINIMTAYSIVDDTCSGYLHTTTCSYVSGIGEYDVEIDQNRATIMSPAHPKIVALANNSDVNHRIDPFEGGYNSTLAGVVGIVYDRWASQVTGANVDGLIRSTIAGSAWQQYADPQAGPPNENEYCISWTDPAEDVLAAFNKLMVYTGLWGAIYYGEQPDWTLDPGLSLHNTITGFQDGTHTVYHTEYRFFVAAAIIELVCLALIAPTYWGWWRAGRATSFSPLEIAKAFDAPLLTEASPNSSGRQLASSFGEKRVKYGGVSDGNVPNGKEKIMFGDPSVVSRPTPRAASSS